jgi:hypothetical protein
MTGPGEQQNGEPILNGLVIEVNLKLGAIANSRRIRAHVRNYLQPVPSGRRLLESPNALGGKGLDVIVVFFDLPSDRSKRAWLKAKAGV